MADNSEVLETTPRDDIPWIDSINVQTDNTPTYSTKGYLKAHSVHKSRSLQAFIRVQMIPTNRTGKAAVTKKKV